MESNVLRKIRKVPCWRGIQASFDLQAKFAAWLCEQQRQVDDLTYAGLLPLCGSEVVRNWFWDFLGAQVDGTALLDDARLLASLAPGEKSSLAAWIEIARDVSAQFTGQCLPWPTPPRDHAGWSSFKRLMQAFYEKWSSKGLPFDEEGNAVADNGVTYKQFVSQFREVHGSRVCVLCGGALGTPQVDHWIEKASFPLLSLSPDNLLPICYECNRTGVKGAKAAFKQGDAAAFMEWFHPFFRPGFGRFELHYDETDLCVLAQPNQVEDAARVENLNRLLSLHERWTSEYKAMYGELQKKLRKLVQNGRMSAEPDELRAELGRDLEKLIPEEIHSELRGLLLRCSLDPARLHALVMHCQG